jgi:hypothetical protein
MLPSDSRDFINDSRGMRILALFQNHAAAVQTP